MQSCPQVSVWPSLGNWQIIFQNLKFIWEPHQVPPWGPCFESYWPLLAPSQLGYFLTSTIFNALVFWSGKVENMDCQCLFHLEKNPFFIPLRGRQILRLEVDPDLRSNSLMCAICKIPFLYSVRFIIWIFFLFSFFFFFFCFFFCAILLFVFFFFLGWFGGGSNLLFLGPHPQHMDIPRLGVELEL